MTPAASAELPALAQRYLTHCRVEKRLAERTLALYTEDLIKLAGLAASVNTPLENISPVHARRFVAQMNAAGRSPRGIALIASGWRNFYAWLGREGLVAANPLADVRTPKVPRPLPKALSVDDAVALASLNRLQAQPALQDAKHAAWRETRDALVVELLYGCGLRMGELESLDLSPSATSLGWIDAESREVHVTGKGSKRRTMPLGAAAAKAFAAWQAVRSEPFNGQAQANDSGALFVTRQAKRLSYDALRQAVQQRAQAAGLAAKVNPHMLRHSFASHVLQSSGDLRAVQELLGHADISTTQIYTRLDFQHLAKAYDAAHPRAKRKPD
jgi:integrase/recombinase XerC